MSANRPVQRYLYFTLKMIPLPLIFGNHVFPPAVKKFRKIPELVGDGHDNVGEGEIVLQVPALPAVPGDVDVEPGAWALAHLVRARLLTARKEGAPVVAVQRDVEHLLRGVEHALDPVPVVHVPVQDEHALEAVNRDCVLGRNGHVVE